MSGLTANFSFYLPAEGDGQDNGQVWTTGINGNFSSIDALLKSHADSIAAKMTNPMTTPGDMIVGEVSGSPARVGVGTNGHILTMVAGAPAWAAAPSGGASLSPNVCVNGATADSLSTGVVAIPVGVKPSHPESGVAQIFAAFSPTNVVPNMTSFTAPSGVVSSNDYYPSTPPWCAFNAGSYSGWINNGTNLPAWIKYQLPSSVVSWAYEITPWSADNFPARCPTSWKFQGSNDNSTWTDLDIRTVSSLVWVPNQPIRFAFGNSIAYTYYRLYITANGGNIYTGIRQLKILSDQPSGTNGIGLFIMDNNGVVKQFYSV